MQFAASSTNDPNKQLDGATLKDEDKDKVPRSGAGGV